MGHRNQYIPQAQADERVNARMSPVKWKAKPIISKTLTNTAPTKLQWFQPEHNDDMFQPEHSDDMFRLEHYGVMFQLEHCDDVFQPEHHPQKPSDVTAVYLCEKSLQCSGRNIGRVLHTNSTCAWQFDLAFEMRIELFCEQLWLLDNLWDASSLLPIRRAAWVRLRLPST